jgi:DNA-directed RNA polymerase subunit omega
MSLMQPPIDELLDKSNNDKYLLCAIASERARDINDMMRGQRDRAIALQSATQIAQLAGRKPLSLAMEEIYRNEVGFDGKQFGSGDTLPDDDAQLGGNEVHFGGSDVQLGGQAGPGQQFGSDELEN